LAKIDPNQNNFFLQERLLTIWTMIVSLVHSESVRMNEQD